LNADKIKELYTFNRSTKTYVMVNRLNAPSSAVQLNVESNGWQVTVSGWSIDQLVTVPGRSIDQLVTVSRRPFDPLVTV